jgi:vitamin-K-epoxide reductase (warfarin-sensitive)
MIYIQILAMLGMILSVYSLYVEKRLERQKDYAPVCDISKKISCSAAFSSKYSKTLGIHNSILGIGFYVAIFILSLTYFASLVLYLAGIGMLITLYLAYSSYFKLKNFCLVCTSIYLVNILLLILAWIKFA